MHVRIVWYINSIVVLVVRIATNFTARIVTASYVICHHHNVKNGLTIIVMQVVDATNSKWPKLRRQKRDVVKRVSKKKKTTTTTTKRATTTTTVPRRKNQTIKMKTMAKTPKAQQRAEIRARVKAQFEAKKNVASTAVAAVAATNGVAAASILQVFKGYATKMLLLLINSVIDFCFDCIITSGSNIGTGDGNAPINLTCNTTTTKTCSACGQKGHCRTTSKKYPIYWQRRKESAVNGPRLCLSSTTGINYSSTLIR
jgi:hypothetical protein